MPESDAATFRSLFVKTAGEVPDEARADWMRYVEDVAVDGVWARSQLSARHRSLITVAAVAALGCPSELRTQIRVSLHNGLSTRELCEVMFQVAGYAGLPVGLEAMRALREVMESEPVTEAHAAPVLAGDVAPAAAGDRAARGMAILAKLRPDVAYPRGEPLPFAPDWHTWMLETAFGDLWARPNLTLDERERVTLAVLIVLSHDLELGAHLRICHYLGIPPIEIGESIMHLAVYVGFPTSVKAMRIATETFQELSET